MFGLDKSIAVQDPSYPVYVDTTVMMGNTGGHNGTGFDGIQYMVCTPENNFFPDLDKVGEEPRIAAAPALNHGQGAHAHAARGCVGWLCGVV